MCESANLEHLEHQRAVRSLPSLHSFQRHPHKTRQATRQQSCSEVPVSVCPEGAPRTERETSKA